MWEIDTHIYDDDDDGGGDDGAETWVEETLAVIQGTERKGEGDQGGTHLPYYEVDQRLRWQDFLYLLKAFVRPFPCDMPTIL